ncbi:LysR family transcriptional regulator, nitrogen assimilation regulatory protein [Prauserella aidingensis]|uniref:LysR substrate-binding domain-containing protein n=1 Tax=Prauserella aidingensis TaxID=387890 RepID=UPI0020A4C91C|nr:LysR substrate-binding domain-containing protein [Prauserella aidingensis]MCP2252591.1 LysR family transcriptional regulator, nitrogen assimilation regulatory protein [Prauserella aidingensis]
MDIAHLRDFIGVVEAGSLSTAAHRLHVSQPALSQRMTQLETRLGVQLLVRGPRGVRPTPTGTALYRDAQQLVRQFDRLAHDVADHRDRVHGPVAVGLPTTVAARLAPALFDWVTRHYPWIHLQLFESMSGYIHELLLAGRLDLAAVFREDDAPRPGEVPLYSEELYLVGRPEPRPPSDHEVALADLYAVPLVTPGPNSHLRALIDRTFAAAGVRPAVVGDVESLGTMLRIAQGGRACTILPLSVVPGHGGAGEQHGGGGEYGGGAGDLGVRRIVEPGLRRYVAIRTTSESYEPREAVVAVRRGVVEVTERLAAEGRWPGIG